MKEVKEIEAKLEELDMKILRKRYRNETIDLETLLEQKIELETTKKK